MSAKKGGMIGGDPCCEGGCDGRMRQIGGTDRCYCFRSAPCHYCTEAEFECDTCSRTTEDDEA